jgi:hypothetical protein
MEGWWKMFEAMGGVASSLIAASGLVFVAYLTFLLNRRMQIEAAWRTDKLGYYREFIDSLGNNLVGESNDETHRRFARASNNLLLIGSPAVLIAHHTYREHIRVSNSDRDYKKDEPLLADLINAIRQDLGLKSDLLSSDHARLWASGRPLPTDSKQTALKPL